MTPKQDGLKQENFMVQKKKTFILPRSGQGLKVVAYFFSTGYSAVVVWTMKAGII